MTGTSNGHITDLKQSILETFDIYATNSRLVWKSLPEPNTILLDPFFS